MASVLVETRGALGHIQLNRPEALNSLTPEMVGLIDAGVTQFSADPAIKAIAISGAGPRGFCAGGDIKLLGQMGRSAPSEALAFWAAEYRLNARIHRLQKPWLALMDGICMGGGVGLSVHGSYRIVTERTRFAMPETGIGYFPDVGASYVLPRANDYFGFYIGLTGAAVTAADALRAGLADAFVPSAQLDQLLADIAAGLSPSEAIRQHQAEAGPSRLADQRDLIAKAFDQPGVSAIFTSLADDGSDFALETLAKLRAQSPNSLVITHDLLRRGAALPDLEACLAQELAANRFILCEADFYEGIRAAVIDKDRSPRWQPPRLEDVDQAALLQRFGSAIAR